MLNQYSLQRFACLLTGILLLPSFLSAQALPLNVRTPVIIDTDIGDDTDDAWALVYALKDPELDVKLVTTTYGKQQYRGALIAKLLTAAGRTDIPIGLGAGPDLTGFRMQKWIGDFSLAQYTGKVNPDGAQAIIDAIHASPTPITVIAIGPLNTLGAALQKDPTIAAQANLVAMAGSIRIGYGNKPGQIGEYNVCRDVTDAKKVFSAPWLSVAITPLDTGDSVSLVGVRYNALLNSGDPLLQALLDSGAVAFKVENPAKINFSGSGFDTVAVLLAEHDPSTFANLETLQIKIDDHGKTMIDPSGREMKVATTWKDLNGYLDHFKNTLLLKTNPN